MNGEHQVALYQGQFKTPPYQHQVQDVGSLLDHEHFALLSEMGTGKTKTVIDAACILRCEMKIDLVIVVCPAAVRGVWTNPEFGEIRKHSWLKSYVMDYHNPSRRAWDDGVNELDWLVTNYEFIRRTELQGKKTIYPHVEELKKLAAGRRVLLVADESSFIKSRTAAQTRAMVELGKIAARRIILNGTPIGNNPFDLWAQMYFVRPGILPYKNFYHFRSEYAVMGGFGNHKVIQWKNLDRLQDLVRPYAVRREKKDCMDLPPKIYMEPVQVALEPKTWSLYKEMRDEAIVWMDQNPSMAAQAGVRIMRLAQIVSGFLGGFANEEGLTLDDSQPKEVSREKLDWLRGYVERRLTDDPTSKIIVWCRFRAELERVAADLKDLVPTYRLYGQGKAEREAAVAAFTKVSPEPALLAAQPQAGGFGLNLVAANTVVYLSNDYNLMSRLQSEDRAHRGGQVRSVTYQDVLAVGPKGQKTVDHHIVKALRSKNDLATWTVRAWRKLLEEE